MTKFNINNLDFSFTDADVVNPDDFVPAGDCNPHNVRPWLLHDHGFTVAVVFASCLQDAIDEAVDDDKMERYSIDITEKDSSYHTSSCCFFQSEDPASEFDRCRLLDPDCDCDLPGVSFLGNAGETFDIETLGYIELPNPRASFTAQFEAHQEAEQEADDKRSCPWLAPGY